MAATNVRKVQKVMSGTGTIADADKLATNVTVYPLNSVYINRTTGFVYVRKAVVGVAADWQTGDA